MVTTTSRLLCRNREWVGELPKCKPKQVPEGVCAEVSCDHICKEVDGRPVCSCYKGFKLEEDKCIGKLYLYIFVLFLKYIFYFLYFSF